MKRHLSTVIGACLGLCAGSALCYFALAIPHRGGEAITPAPQRVVQQEKATVTIAGDGGLYLRGERLDLIQLAARCKELGERQPVVIRPDRNTEVKRLVDVVNTCKAAGVSEVLIARVPAS